MEARRSQQAPARRCDEVLDDGAEQLFCDIHTHNPLDFPGYSEKIAGLQERTGQEDAVVCYRGAIAGHPVVCVEMLKEFMMASMGTTVGETVCRAAEQALEDAVPLIVFCASGGARMQEGMYSLMQMVKTSAAVRRLQAAGGLYIAVLTNPTTGGVTASFAMQGDIILAEPDALIGFAGPRVIEQTIGRKLPPGFQRSEFQLEHGFVDAIVPRSELRSTLARILDLHSSAGPQNLRDRHPVLDTGSIPADAANGADVSAQGCSTDDLNPVSPLSPYQQVEIARMASRPHVRDFIAALFGDFIELHGDRLFADDRALITGIGTFEGQPVSVAGHVKGSDLNSNMACNFGMPGPEGYRKFIRVARAAEKFGRPLITFIDTPGAYPGAEAEERGQGEAIAQSIYTLSGLRTPIIAVLTGEGGSGGALALGVADYIIMLEHAVYSVLSPEGFASILWKDAKRSKEACDVMRLTSSDLLGFGMVDAVVPEPATGAQEDPDTVMAAIEKLIAAELPRLSALSPEQLVEQRYQRFRRFV
jgi:acetyl-CoA carboxylase carboxyl transferase subunit beta